MTNKYFGLCLLSAVTMFCGRFAQAYDASWEGNHTDAKSEAWTWMGHLQEVVSDSTGSPSLGPNGVGFIYYYTRNDEGKEGSMDFRSSALTTTLNGVGTSYDTHTIYENEYDGAQLRVRSGVLDLAFQAGTLSDTVATQPMTAADQTQLTNALALFPGLAAAPGFAPTKTAFQVSEENGTSFNLNFYAIWPVLSPANGQLRFLGQEGTYEFASPMLVTVGTYNGKQVAGLSFMDRQWAPEYFGMNIMTNIADMLTPGHALNFSHSWSAFHAFNERTHEWSFFHLWHQYQRADNVADTLVDYSDMMWMKSGTSSGLVKSSDYQWVSTGYALEKGTQVMLDYASGSYGFFPSRANYNIPSLGFTGEMRAVPALQSLNQPVYFYEGFASGEGTWNGDPMRLQGRLESSRLLFRSQDYQEMLANLSVQTSPQWQQTDLQAWLQTTIAANQTAAAAAANPVSWFASKFNTVSSLMTGMSLKLAVVKSILSGDSPSADPNDPTVMIYH